MLEFCKAVIFNFYMEQEDACNGQYDVQNRQLDVHFIDAKFKNIRDFNAVFFRRNLVPTNVWTPHSKYAYRYA
jgi:hypothetical protein